MMNLPRRVTASKRCPGRTAAKTSGTGKRSTLGWPNCTAITCRPTTAARRARATVSTSRSSGTRRLAKRCHLLPVLADLDVDHQRHDQLGSASHRVANQGDRVLDLVLGAFEHQPV